MDQNKLKTFDDDMLDAVSGGSDLGFRSISEIKEKVESVAKGHLAEVEGGIAAWGTMVATIGQAIKDFAES